MAKKKTEHVMWALWNFNCIMGVKHRRKAARDYAIELHPEGAAKMFRTKAFHITKVIVREI